MSWIVEDLWKALEKRRGEYEHSLKEGKLEAFTIINRIAVEVGNKWGIFLQVNFPPGQSIRETAQVGHRDLSILVYRERRRFEGVTQEELKEAIRLLNPVSYDGTGFGYEGLRVKLVSGRIDCLPGGVHLWCEITPDVLRFLDWLFVHAFGLKPA